VEYRWLVGYNFTKTDFGPPEIIREKFSRIIRCYDNEHVYFHFRRATGALQHSLALNKVLREVNTRFLLVLDPDFYCVRPNWIGDIVKYVKSSRTAVIGSTWHPKNYKKYRYFPSIHFMLIDLHQIGKEFLDFRASQQDDRKIEQKTFSVVSLFLKKLFRKRTRIGVNVDPGTRIYDRFRYSDLITETFRPSYLPYRPKSVMSRLGHAYTVFSDLFFDKDKRIMPDRTYFTQKRFRDYGFDDLYGENWEEYFWIDEPFGFHVRNTLTSESVSYKEALGRTSVEQQEILRAISRVTDFTMSKMEQRDKDLTHRDSYLSNRASTDRS